MGGGAAVEQLSLDLEAISVAPIEVEQSSDGAVLIALVPFEYRAIEGTLELHVFVTPSDTTLVLAAELHDADPVILEARAKEFGIDWDIHDDEEVDIVTLLVGHEVPEGESVDVAGTARRLMNDLRSLLEVGAVQLVDVRVVDETFEADFDSLGPLKREDPRAATDLLEDLATRAHDLGARSLAAELRLARAEVLNDLGAVAEALAVADEEWAMLGEPCHRTELVASYAGVLARAGQVDRALELTRSCLDITDDRGGRAALLGNMGALLHIAGRRAESIEWLTAAINDPFISDADRALHEANLISMHSKDPRSARFVVDDTPDLLVDVDRWIDEVRHRLISMSQLDQLVSTIEELRPRLREYMSLWDRLGPSQRVRLLLMEAQFEARLSEAGVDAIIAEAATIAMRNGDRVLIEGVEDVARLLGLEGGVDPSHEPAPWERLAIATNRVHREMVALMERARPQHGAAWLEQLIEVIDAASEEIRGYGDLRARDSLRRASGRTYELALLAAELAQSPEAALDTIERLRDQGSPRVGSRQVDGEVERHVADRMRRVPTTLPVSTHACVRTTPRKRDELEMAVVANAVAGPPAWWWSAHKIEARLHWGVRAPDGRCWAGVVEGAAAVARWFRSSSATERADGTSSAALAPIDLAAIATELLPTPLMSAVEAGVQAGTPIRVACAFSRDIATIPLVLLPLPSGARVLDGMIAAKAPPPWAHRLSVDRGGARSLCDVSLAIGVDPRIGDLPDLAGLDASGVRLRMLGGPAQLRSGSCTELATPQTVERAWSRDETDVGVFYGHIVGETEAAPLGGGLELCDERGRPARWTVASMLAADPGGLAPVVVLAGCASMGFASQLATEWWGPACGLLWRGAHHVIGTHWEVVHGPDNVEFVADLIGVLRAVGDDVPAALRAAQLPRSRRFTQDVIARSELPVWSAYSVVGATPLE